MALEHQNMQFLGIFGIFRESIKIIYTGRRIFTRITLTFILPFYISLFVYMKIMNLFPGKIIQTTTPKSQNLSDIFSSQTIDKLLVKAAYFIFSTVFSFHATAAVVYTVACIAAARDVTYKQVMNVVTKVWKRVFVTSLCVFGATFAFNIVALLTLSLILMVVFVKYGEQGLSPGIIITLSLFLICFFVGLLYLTIIWQLSSVVSVLEDLSGFKAMAKSKALLKGKMWMSRKVYVLLSFPPAAIQLAFYYLFLQSASLGVVIKVILGIVYILLLSFFFLFVISTETVFYFVCKSFHHEEIDKLDLSDNFPVHLPGVYAPLATVDVPAEKFDLV